MKVQQKIVVAVLLISSAMNLMARQLYTKNGMKATQGSDRSYKGAIANKDINMMTPAEIVKLKYNDLNTGQRDTLWFVAINSGLAGQRRAAQQVIDATQAKPLNWSQLQADAQSKGLKYVMASHTPLPADEEEATSSSSQDRSLLGVSAKSLTEDENVSSPEIRPIIEEEKKGQEKEDSVHSWFFDEWSSANDNQNKQSNNSNFGQNFNENLDNIDF